MRRSTNLLVSLSLSLFTVACAKKDKSGGGGPGETQPPSEQNPTDGDDQNADQQPPGPTPAGAGTVTIDLSGATAVGVAEFDKNSQLKDASGNVVDAAKVGTVGVAALTENSSAKALTKVLADGSLVALPFKNDKESEIEKVIPVGPWGVVIQFTGSGPFASSNANLWWVDAKQGGVMRAIDNGDGKELRTNLGSRVEYDEEKGELYAVLNGSLYRFKFETEALEQITDDEQVIDKFIRLSDGSLYFDGRLKSNNAQILRRLKSNNGFENFYNDAGAKTLENFGSVGRRGVIGSRAFEVVSDQMQFHFLPGSLNHNNTYGKDAPVVGNNWLISFMGGERRAFNLTEDKIAGNPWALNNGQNLAGTTPGVARTNVDTAQGLYFDGANIVSVTRSGSELTSNVSMKLTYANGTLLKVERVFGPDHGFSTYWGAYAVSQDGKLYWTSINPDSGAVEVDGAKIVDGFPTTIVSATDMAQNSTVYKVGSTLVVLRGGTPVVSHLDLNETTQKFDLTEKISAWITSGADDYLSMHSYAAVGGGQLYIAGGKRILAYDPTDPATYTEVTPAVTYLTSGAENGAPNENDCKDTRRFKAVFTSVDRTKPMAVYRTCTQGTTSPALMVVTFNSWSDFTQTAEPAVDLQLSLLPSSLRLIEPVRALEGNSTRLMFLDRVGKSLVSLDSVGTAREAGTLDASSIKTNGNVRIATQFAAAAGAVEVAAPWTGTSLLVSGTYGSTYKSFRSDLSSRTESAVDDLDGIQIYSVSLNSKGTLIVNGLRSDDNKKVILRFDPDGALLGTDESSNVKIVSIQPFGG